MEALRAVLVVGVVQILCFAIQPSWAQAGCLKSRYGTEYQIDIHRMKGFSSFEGMYGNDLVLIEDAIPGEVEVPAVVTFRFILTPSQQEDLRVPATALEELVEPELHKEVRIAKARRLGRFRAREYFVPYTTEEEIKMMRSAFVLRDKKGKKARTIALDYRATRADFRKHYERLVKVIRKMKRGCR